MTLALTPDSAARLYTMLDEAIGVFRVNDPSPRAQEFYEEKKAEFLQTFASGAPEVYWFQSEICQSAELHSNSTGFEVFCPHPSREVKQKLQSLNKKLKHADLEII